MFVVTDMLLILLEDDQKPKARLEFRKKWSKQIVDRLMDMLRRFRAAGDYCHRDVSDISLWEDMLAADGKSFRSPEHIIYVWVVGKLYIEQSEFW